MFSLHGNQSLNIVYPCTDYGFKRAFHNEVVACGFLNTVLGFSGKEEIQDVRFLDKELPSHEPLGRNFIVDLLCEAVNVRRFLIEMQKMIFVQIMLQKYLQNSVVLLPIGIQK